MMQWMLAVWSLVLLPFLNPTCTSVSFWFTYCWSLAWRILSITLLQFSSVQSLSRPHGLQHTRLPWPSPTPRACSNSCPPNQGYHPTISFSVIRFSSCLQSFPASGFLPMSQFFISQSSRASTSASVLPMNMQDWFPLRLTGLISLLSNGLSRVFSNSLTIK